MKQEEVVFKRKVNTYVYVYDNLGFIHVFDSENIEEPTTQCLKTYKCQCNTKKDFELEVLYLSASGPFDSIIEDED